MLYLFNSAYRPLYRENVLNTFFLPTGLMNDYRYLRRNLDPDLYAHPESAKLGSSCLVVFVDRNHAGGYRFLPMRQGTLAKVNDDQTQGQLRFRVRLGDFVFPQDINGFNADLVSRLAPKGLPQLTNNDPTSVEDGFYAIWDDAHQRFGAADLQIGDKAWPQAVDWLLETQTISPPDSPPAVFVRCDILSHSGKTVKPRKSKQSYVLKSGQQHLIRCSYRCSEEASGAGARVKVEASEGVRFTRPSAEFSVNALREQCDFPVTAKRFPEESKGGISLRGDPNAVVASASVPFSLGDGFWYWARALGLLLVYAATAGFIALIADRLENEAWTHLLTRDWYVLAAVVVQTFALFWLVRMFGRRPI